MSAGYQGLATKGLKGLKVAGWYAKTLALNLMRRGLILARYTLACWQKQRVNKAMRRLGEQFFQALEQGEANPLALNLRRRGLILARYTLACWQKQRVNKAMRRLGEQFFQALEQGETNP